ncbi:uncharacterized protein LOC111491585 [Cucurbita maxima]|uniref:Uncharacterized protein LOC111491585 n=2 Tax=Cucurbita TaxID=3660 RepID=A0A6J1K8D8_CUCMA|nr:uncharacterized protein LOC111459363 [Cucurbita moschata]XP_022996319.1 uncharacterized protein LOC111491585 [Cucurbita maxima]
MGVAQALKRIPRIKFPKRHPNPSGSTSQTPTSIGVDDQVLFLSLNEKASKTIGGKASLQPKRTPMSNEEIEAILLGGCI